MASFSESYTQQQAQVRIGTQLCDQEKDFIQKRLAGAKNALEKILGTQLTDSQVPKIALCASGGGARAALTTLGALKGATSSTNENLNILDLCSYFATLSGSTWALSGLVYSGMNAQDYIEHFAAQITKGLLDDFNLEDLTLELKKKEANNQPISFVDVYGILLAQRLFNHLDTDCPSAINLADYIQRVDAAKIPFPIQTSIIGNQSLDHYEWVEYTPYEIGTLLSQSFIPTWAFNRTFNNGSSTNAAPPLSLGFCIGMWSSAMCIDPKDFFEVVVKDKWTKEMLQNMSQDIGSTLSSYLEKEFGTLVSSAANIFEKLHLDHLLHLKNTDMPSFSGHHFSPAQAYNWTYGMKDMPLSAEQFLTLVDAGIDINIPLPPLLRPEREIDIIIVLDASDNPSLELEHTKTFAEKHGLYFPTITMSDINKPCAIFKDPSHQESPIVIFMPLIQNPGYQNNWNPWSETFTSTFNAQYTVDQTHQLTGLMQYNMQQSMPMILDTIKQCIENKKNIM